MIYGQRIRLRPIEQSDQAFLVSLAADPVVRANVVGWGFPTSLHEQERWFAGHVAGSTHRWIIETHEGESLGMTGLWDVDWHNRNAYTGVKIGGASTVGRGRGMGRDAIKTAMAFAFYDVGLHRLHANILASNAASLKAYVDACGWSVEGVGRQQIWRNGAFVDLVHIGILKDEFDRLPDAKDYADLVRHGPGPAGNE